jgi:hypothetical protein
MISTDRYANLWSCMTSYIYGRSERGSEQRERGEEVLDNLAKSSRWSGQEISLEPLEDGWKITIFSCYTHSYDENGDHLYEESPKIILFVPKDATKPPTLTQTEGG